VVGGWEVSIYREESANGRGTIICTVIRDRTGYGGVSEDGVGLEGG
jgi:hypothetical protein